MNYFKCTRGNKFITLGQWVMNEGEGEDFFLCDVVRVGKTKYKFSSKSLLRLPYAQIAPFVTPLGVVVPMSDRNKPLPTDEVVKREIEKFQHSVEDIVEPELDKRHREADPTYTGRTTDRTKDKEL